MFNILDKVNSFY